MRVPEVSITDEKFLRWHEFGKYGTFEMTELETLCHESEIIFVCVETPHAPEYEGITPIPHKRVDFKYDALVNAVTNLNKHIDKPTPVVISSTVLPGTTRERIIPIISDNVQICYSPVFVAMSTAARDFLDPEFTLLGVEDEDAAAKMYTLCRTIHKAPIHECTIEEAELTKVAYNTFIGMKIIFANTLMEICHKTDNCNVDVVTDGIKLGTRRLISTAYLAGGMGDGGGCHPRDNIALSWLARKLDLSSDIFSDIMSTREDHAAWLSEVVVDAQDEIWKDNLELTLLKPILILGTSFKPESNIEVGSPALLCKHYLEEWGYSVMTYDPFVDTDRGFGWSGSSAGQAILIGTKHEVFKKWKFPQDSIVIDPFRYLEDQEGVEIIRVGE